MSIIIHRCKTKFELCFSRHQMFYNHQRIDIRICNIEASGSRQLKSFGSMQKNFEAKIGLKYREHTYVVNLDLYNTPELHKLCTKIVATLEVSAPKMTHYNY